MILVDSSIWIDHLHVRDERIASLAAAEMLLVHPFVIGEVLLGSLRERKTVVEYLTGLPEADLAETSEVFDFLERNRLFGRGIGFVDLHLLVSTRLTPMAKLWTRDKRLLAAAEELGISYRSDH
ncbi:ribonuclease [Rhizobium albus]|jgi:predicted nucleic acid-binding protein|nr:ribonuclease [Rhizobium albus]